MSILIRGIEMPLPGQVWSIDIHSTGVVCDYYDLNCNQIATAVHVPQHGDLIDRDGTLKKIRPLSQEDEYTACTFDTVKKLMHTLLNDSPTIIPASKEGE